MVLPGQRLDRLCAKIKFLKIRVLLHFAIENSKLVCKITRDSVLWIIEFFRNCELNRGSIMLFLLHKLYAVQGVFVKYERAVGASSSEELGTMCKNNLREALP